MTTDDPPKVHLRVKRPRRGSRVEGTRPPHRVPAGPPARPADPRTPLDGYPPQVHQRIRDLRRAVRKSGGWWEPRPPRSQGAPGGSDAPEGLRTRLGEALAVALVVVALPGAWLIGVVTIIVLLVRLLS